MKQLFDDLQKTFTKNNINELNLAVEEKKLTYLYGFYHYYFGDEDSILDLMDHIKYTKEFFNFAQGFFEEDSYDEKIIDIIVPYYVQSSELFDLANVKNMIGQVQSIILQIKNKSFSISAHESLLRDYWDGTTDDKLVIKIITNAELDFDNKTSFQEKISNITPLCDNVSFDIVFGDDIKEEISQLTSDKKCVDSSELTIDREGNYLTYGNEQSIICNVSAKSLRDNYIKYGKAGLFAMNLRFYIANKKVDEGLERSIKEKGNEFWYFNNGIIIVCDDYKIEGTTVKLKNFSIVNGGQTTRMIGVIPFKDDFVVSCKIIKNMYQDDKEQSIKFVAATAEASNTQKPINSSDLIANRYEQRFLKEKLAEKNIFMQIKRGDIAAANLKDNYPEPWQKVKNSELGQLLYATTCQRPGTARNSKDKIFSDKSKYSAVFGNVNDLNLDYVKDLLILKSYYAKWSNKVKKDPYADEYKKGLVRNGYFYFAATTVLIAKFAFSKDLTNALTGIGVNSEKGNYIISQKTFNHRLFNDEYYALENRIFNLFEMIYQKYILKEFNVLKSVRPELAYSNYTKVDKNYTTAIAVDVYYDCGETLQPFVASAIAPLFYKESEGEQLETRKLVEEAITSFDTREEDDDDPIDEVAEDLKTKLQEYRTKKYKELGISAYNVFTNKELDALVALKPRTTFELMQSNCFKNHPKTKVRQYGKDIVDIIVSVCGDK